METTRAPSRVLAVGSTSEPELNGPVPKKGRWEDECIGFIEKDLKDIL